MAPGDNSEQAIGATANCAHVLICASPALGHVTPVLMLARRIAAHGNTVTFVSSEVQVASLRKVEMDSSGQCIEGRDIRFVGVSDGFPINDRSGASSVTYWELIENMESEIERYMERLMDRETLATADAGPPTCIITDMHLWYTQNVADRLKIPRYVFFPTSALYVALMWCVPQLVSQGLLRLGQELRHGHLQENGGVLKMPGFPALPTSNFPSSSIERPQTYLRCAACLSDARGFLINTVSALESDGIATLATGMMQVHGTTIHHKVPVPHVMAVGPLDSSNLVRQMLSNQDEESCIQFLNSKSPSSVVYVAFGSEANLTATQMQELAMGLEASEQSFLWVLRIPSFLHSSQSPSKAKIIDSMVSAMLPPGFRERTAGHGLVLPHMVPQLQVLLHASTGAFFTHCGWNSVMESIHRGVPLLAFPIQAEQMINCRIMIDQLKVGIEVQRTKHENENKLGIARKEEVERVVRRMLTGDERLDIQKRVEELRKLIVMANDPNIGSARNNLQAFLEEIKK